MSSKSSNEESDVADEEEDAPPPSKSGPSNASGLNPPLPLPPPRRPPRPDELDPFPDWLFVIPSRKAVRSPIFTVSIVLRERLTAQTMYTLTLNIYPSNACNCLSSEVELVELFDLP